MKSLEDLSIGHRIALTLIIVLIILFALALIGYLTGGWDKADAQQSDPAIYEGVPLDATLLRLDRQALEEAYHDQVKHLFTIWLKSTQAGDLQAFTNGLKIARRGYTGAAQQIAKREQQLLELDRRMQERR